MPDRTVDPMHRGSSASRLPQKLSCEAVEAAIMPPTCGARTRSGAPCRNMAMARGRRCRMHGGLSTGPRTPEGIERHRAAVTRHGGRSQEMAEFRRTMRELRAGARKLIEMA